MTETHPDFVLTEIDSGTTHAIPAGSASTLGRDAACEIQILHSSVSRKHALIEHSGDELRFSDLGSSNGSRVNGAPVEGKQLVQHGDTLSLGDIELRLTRADSAGAVHSGGDATVIGGATAEDAAIPSTWADKAGLERASQTQFVVKAGAKDTGDDPLQALPPATAPRLVVVQGALTGNVFELGGSASAGESRSWKIGRTDECDIQLNENSVSGQHAQLVNEGERWKIVNWMSTNGTIVNGRKSLSTYLQNDDRITLGNIDLVFQLPPTARQQTPEPASVAPTTDKKKGFFARLFGR